MTLLVIPAVWLALIVVLVALCVAARRGDTDEEDRLLSDVQARPARAERPVPERVPVAAGTHEQRRTRLAEPAALAGTQRAA